MIDVGQRRQRASITWPGPGARIVSLGAERRDAMRHFARSPLSRTPMSHDLAIARASRLRPIADVAAAAGIPPDALELFGKHIAKLERDYLLSLKDPVSYTHLTLPTKRIV